MVIDQKLRVVPEPGEVVLRKHGLGDHFAVLAKAETAAAVAAHHAAPVVVGVEANGVGHPLTLVAGQDLQQGLGVAACGRNDQVPHGAQQTLCGQPACPAGHCPAQAAAEQHIGAAGVQSVQQLGAGRKPLPQAEQDGVGAAPVCHLHHTHAELAGIDRDPAAALRKPVREHGVLPLGREPQQRAVGQVPGGADEHEGSAALPLQGLHHRKDPARRSEDQRLLRQDAGLCQQAGCGGGAAILDVLAAGVLCIGVGRGQRQKMHATVGTEQSHGFLLSLVSPGSRRK